MICRGPHLETSEYVVLLFQSMLTLLTGQYAWVEWDCFGTGILIHVFQPKLIKDMFMFSPSTTDNILQCMLKEDYGRLNMDLFKRKINS